MLEKFYKEQVVPKLKAELGITNIMRLPKLTKIVINSSTSDALQNSKILDTIAADLTVITGQKAVITKAKKSIATFKLREGQAIGCRVTLRRKRMYEFLNRFANVALPRARDFKGLNKRGFDGRGNYTCGITEHIIFPEIVADRIEKSRGMNITFVTTAQNDKEGELLLRALGLPLRT
ncbi:50S ribosomal protein L5 [bacterium]|nr:50S ribosomal protein L5 [bacterium]